MKFEGPRHCHFGALAMKLYWIMRLMNQLSLMRMMMCMMGCHICPSAIIEPPDDTTLRHNQFVLLVTLALPNGTLIPKKEPTGSTPTQNSCMVISWQDKLLRWRISLVFALLLGHHPNVNMEFRVSTDQKLFIVDMPVNSALLSAESALYGQILNSRSVKSDETGQNYKLTWSVLDSHAKMIAYNKAVAKMLGRDKTKKDVVERQHRIALPWKCQYGYVL
jgi:hypothetical protein